MHIAVNGWFWNRPETGSGQYTRQLVTLLPSVASGCHVTVFVPQTSSENSRCESNESADMTLQYLPCNTSSLAKVWWEQVTVPRFAKRVKADLLHIPYWAPPVRSVIPTAVTIHDIIPAILPAYRGSPLVRLYTAFVAATSRSVDAILTDSDASKRDIIEHLDLEEHRIHTVPLAADNRYTHLPNLLDAEIRAQYNLKDEYILYLGGFDIRKNIEMLLRAFTFVLHSYPNTKLVIAGKLPKSHTTFTPDPRILVRQADLEAESISYPGYVDEAHKAAIFRGARAFVFPSMYEGFGLPPLEAMQCGIPVVGCNRSSIREIVQQGGILVDPDDVQGMAGAIIQLVGDDTFYNKVRQQAITRAESFSWQKTAAKSYEIFNSIIE